MSRHTAELSININRKVTAGIDRQQAIRTIVRNIRLENDGFDKRIREIIKVNGGELNSHHRTVIATLNGWIARNRERLQELDVMKYSG